MSYCAGTLAILVALVSEFRSILISELSEISNISLVFFSDFFLAILLLFIFLVTVLFVDDAD